MREGDRLVVPEYISTVKISGNVMYPNTVSYKPGKSYRWYVNKAGGFGNHARKHKTWIIYPNGTMAQVGHGAKVEPGCEIVVPMKPKPEPWPRPAVGRHRSVTGEHVRPVNDYDQAVLI